MTKAEILVGTLTADRAQTQSYHNPVLQKSYEQLQSMALYSDNAWEAAGGDAVRDTLNPDKAMLGEIEPYIADFFSALPTETTTPKAPKRKKADDDGEGGTAKKAKSDDVGKSAALNWTDLAAQGSGRRPRVQKVPYENCTHAHAHAHAQAASTPNPPTHPPTYLPRVRS